MGSTVKGLDRLVRQMKSIPREILRQAGAAVGGGATDLATKIAAAAPRGRTGHLAASVKAFKKTSSNATSLQGKEIAAIRADSGLTWRVTAGDAKAYYASWVEYGTAPAPARPSRSGKTFRQHGLTTRQTSLMTKAVAAHRGTPAQPYFWPTVRAYKKPIMAKVARGISKAFKAVAAAA